MTTSQSADKKKKQKPPHLTITEQDESGGLGSDTCGNNNKDLGTNEAFPSPGLGIFIGGGDWSSKVYDSNHGVDEAHAYYQKMIEANPGNALLLGNYAKFLKEVIQFIIHIILYNTRYV